MLSVIPTRRRTVAAARVTSAYAASSVLLLVPLLAVGGSMADAMRFLASPLGAWIAVTFALLVLARRAAFTVLWFLTLVAWAWQHERLGFDAFDSGIGFLFWSVLAAPLYVMTVVGFGGMRVAGRAQRIAAIAGIAGWAALVVAGAINPFGFYYGIGCFGSYATTGMRALDIVIAKAWLVVPPVVALDAIRRVHRAPRLVEPRWDDAAS